MLPTSGAVAAASRRGAKRIVPVEFRGRDQTAYSMDPSAVTACPFPPISTRPIVASCVIVSGAPRRPAPSTG